MTFLGKWTLALPNNMGPLGIALIGAEWVLTGTPGSAVGQWVAYDAGSGAIALQYVPISGGVCNVVQGDGNLIVDMLDNPDQNPQNAEPLQATIANGTIVLLAAGQNLSAGAGVPQTPGSPSPLMYPLQLGTATATPLQITVIAKGTADIQQSKVGSGADYSYVDLSGVDFTNCDLSNSIWTGADLTDATLANGNLTNADLSATIIGADDPLAWDCVNLTNANLGNPMNALLGSFRGANLTGANFAGIAGVLLDFSTAANGSQTNFTGTKFNGVDLQHATFDPNPVFSQDPHQLTDFTNAKVTASQLPTTGNGAQTGPNWSNLCLVGTQIVGLPVSGGALQLAYLNASGANLSGWQLAGANLQHSIFNSAVLAGADLSEANLNFAQMDSVWLEALGGFEPATLSGASMMDAVLSNAHLTGVVMSGVALYGQSATLKQATMTLIKLAAAYLANVDFSGVKDLSGADFTEACLVNAVFGLVPMMPFHTTGGETRTTFYQACLQGANFSQSELYGVDLTAAAIATAPGTIQVTTPVNGKPWTQSLPYPATQLPPNVTDPTTVCPNGAAGPCTAGTLINPKAPAQWPVANSASAS